MTRRAYRPKGENPRAWAVAMQGASLLSAEDQLKRAARLRAAVQMAEKSSITNAEWREIFDAVNMVEAFGKVGPVKDAAEFVREQQLNIEAILNRQRETRSNCLRPCEIEKLRELASTYAQVLAVVTHNEYFKAEQLVIRKVAQAISRGSHGSVKVLEAA